MNRSPLFVIGLNKIIGRIMRRLQLTTGLVRVHLKRAKYWAEQARKAWKHGDYWLAYHHAKFAHEWLQDAVKASKGFKRPTAA